MPSCNLDERSPELPEVNRILLKCLLAVQTRAESFCELDSLDHHSMYAFQIHKTFWPVKEGDWFWMLSQLSRQRPCCGSPRNALHLSFYAGQEMHPTIFLEICSETLCWQETRCVKPAPCYSLWLLPCRSMWHLKTQLPVWLTNAQVCLVSLPMSSPGASPHTWAHTLVDLWSRWNFGLPATDFKPLSAIVQAILVTMSWFAVTESSSLAIKHCCKNLRCTLQLLERLWCEYSKIFRIHNWHTMWYESH